MPNRLISEVMKGNKLVSIEPGGTVHAAAKKMADNHVGAIVILEAGNRLVGIFTERDLLKRVVAPGLDPDTTKLDDVMTPHPVTITSMDTVRSAMAEMHDNQIRHLPVVDHGKIAGILSMRDFVGTEIAELEQVAEFEERIWESAL